MAAPSTRCPTCRPGEGRGACQAAGVTQRPTDGPRSAEPAAAPTYPSGDLERAVMDHLWDATEPLSVRQVAEVLAGSKEKAYTTVLTVLDRLHDKGFVRREMVGRAYLYTATADRSVHQARLMGEVLRRSTDPQPALQHFVGAMTPAQLAALRELLAERRPPMRRGR